MSTRVITLLAILFVLALVVACNANPQPPGLTPVPSLAPTVPLTPIAALPGQATSPSAQTTATEAPETTGTPEATETEVAFEPPNCSKTDCTQNGPAITQNLKGNAASGAQIFAANCAVCHGPQGKGEIPNPGSEDVTVPSLNPIDEMFSMNNPTLFAQQLDLYIEHGSHTNGLEQMPDWGDAGTLSPQQIADVIAYIISLNPH